jgi:3-methyladenine DNA glycosylase AlkD
MTFEETMTRLKELGTDQNIKVYKRHGAGDNLFGVSFADLRSLHKQIKTDHTLAGKLWNTGNTDARTLALLVADPQKITVEQAENWADDISYYVLADMLAEFISYTKFAKGIMTKWID